MSNHGTTAGYWQHRRTRTAVCADCRAALNEAQRTRRSKQSGGVVYTKKQRELREELDRMPLPSWMADGLCLDYHPDLWFSDNRNAIDRAKEICAGCPVRDLCLQWALDTRERHGVFGGQTFGERANILRRAKYQADRGAAA